MLPSPGFSIPSIGTPLHQPEEDQQIIGNNPYYAQHMGAPNALGGTGSTGLTPSGMTPSGMTPSGMTPNPLASTSSGLTPIGMGSSGMSNSGVGSSGMNNNGMNNMGMPSLMNTPTKMSSYQPSYATPQSMMQPQTPVSFAINKFNYDCPLTTHSIFNVSIRM